MSALVFDIWRLGRELGALCNHFQSGREALDGRGHQGTRGALRATGGTIAHWPNGEMGAERIWAEEIRLTSPGCLSSVLRCYIQDRSVPGRSNSQALSVSRFAMTGVRVSCAASCGRSVAGNCSTVAC